jgi:pSer/pThr/pTyr-binding forkhead associated (FHA) protein
MTAGQHKGVPPLLRVTAGPTGGERSSFRFRLSFRIGRQDDCEVCIKDDYVSRYHAEVSFEDGVWCVRDLGSANGIYVGGQRVPKAPIRGTATIRLGVYGPEVVFETEPTPKPVGQPASPESKPETKHEKRADTTPVSRQDSGLTVSRYIEHYFGNKKRTDAPAGQHTMYIRRAFEHVQSQQKRRYGRVMLVLTLLVFAAAGYAFYEHEEVVKQSAMASDLFYTMKALDVDMANIQRVVAESHNPIAAHEIETYRNRHQELEKNYDQFLASLHVYSPKMSEQQRLVLRVARIFGECELDMPRGFSDEVNKYIKRWQSSGRLKTAVQKATASGYANTISKEMLAQGLPPQFFYLALQESDFDPYISGPKTRSGVPKGMWQFTPQTAVKYGLHLGPLVDLQRPDPGDDRDHPDRSTRAAAKYLKDLYSTDAQASGFLVMACYNWGESQMLPLVRSMPANPKQRNFWKLLANHRDRIPHETYDYVFSIVSAAVIGENPRLFGFDFDNPLVAADGVKAESGASAQAASMQPMLASAMRPRN